MKKLFLLLTVLTLAAALLLPGGALVSARAEGAADLWDYGAGESLPTILRAGEKALEDGRTAEWTLKHMAEHADLLDVAIPYQRIIANIAAKDGPTYKKIATIIDPEEEYGPRKMSIYTSVAEYPGFSDESPYNCPDVSDALREALRDDNAQFCFTPAWWNEAEFKSVLGTAYDKFTPSSPQPGYVCVVIKKGAEASPGVSFEALGKEDDAPPEMYDILSNLVWGMGENAPVLTGNPHLASMFWVFDLKYPYYGRYGSDGDIKGYHCEASLTAVTADKKEVIAQVSGAEKLGDTISSWDNWIAKADMPALDELAARNGMADTLRARFIQERSALMLSRKVTPGNAREILDSTLLAESEKTNDPWEKAILESGAHNDSLEEGTLSFSLYTYDTKVSDMRADGTIENNSLWSDDALSNASGDEIGLSVRVIQGKITHTSLNNAKKLIRAAAAKTREGFESPEMRDALIERVLRAPLSEKPSRAEDLLAPDADFVDWTYGLDGSNDSRALACLAYTQSSPALYTKDGPRAVAVTFLSADPEKLLRDAYQAALDSLAFAAADDRPEYTDEALLNELAQAAFRFNKKDAVSVQVPLTIRLPYDISLNADAYWNSFAYEDYVSRLYSMAERLPEFPALSLPKNGKIKGPSGGAEIILKLSDESSPTYVQIRSVSDDKVVASAFILTGKQVKVNAPAGSYYILYCSGPYWYGEEEMFCDLGTYQKSDTVKLNRSSSLTVTLVTTNQGDLNVYGVDPSAFRQK